MNAAIVFIVILCVVVLFVGGALFFRKHKSRIEADVQKAQDAANTVKAAAQSVVDTTKKL